MAFSSKQFPNMEHRGDIDSDEPSAVVERLRQLDPACKATVIIAAGPPCPDHSRIRSDAPGSQGSEGSKFLRFADFVKKLEAAWDYAQPIMIVENVVPENKQDVKLFEQKLSAQAVVCDAADLGVISRPRLWWTRLPWQQLSNCQNAPARLRWGMYQGIPRVTFDEPPDNIEDYDMGSLAWPRNVSEGLRPLPCLTTPADDPAGRPAPRSCKGKVDSQTQARWLGDNRRYAPWHYQQDNMFVDRAHHDRLALPTPELKEQMHHLPRRVDQEFEGACASQQGFGQWLACWNREVVLHFRLVCNPGASGGVFTYVAAFAPRTWRHCYDGFPLEISAFAERPRRAHV